MHGRRLAVISWSVALALGVAACSDEGSVVTDATTSTSASSTTTAPPGATLSDEARIVYRYGDSSVPPEFHRSYTLEIDREDVSIEVDSYGDVLHTATEPVLPEVWEQMANDAGDVLAISPDPDEESCAGGTSRSLTVVDDDETLLDESWGVCGATGTAAAEVADAWVLPLIDSIDEWESYME